MKIALLSALLASILLAQTNHYTTETSKVPDIQMPDNNLSFKGIEGYQNYKVIATHFRVDKNELRYILVNSIAYQALKNNQKPLPDGSKVVKIGWSVKKMAMWPDALEADKIQRIEYMVKDSKTFNHQGDHWGYARFIKTENGYKAWNKGVQSCISCHSSVQENDYLFTDPQKLF